ncbi:hypothetical protein TRVL_02607 [Trypanosoma vivax]|uniref:Uncharacterized protein n=1 Tax=Trypanosoma vivax (strain Y486) TaxID=1055687 RepID=G0TTW1_TRYVY|nr:hypothetical protein TRVL_02607 [Trypanosoma vivax]CCC47394.1 conserved hypothetical protein [Trypanosoma vivax Y486]
MGYHEQQTLYGHREVLKMQKRLTSFLLTFSVIALGFIVVVASMQTSRASCQMRASAAIHRVYVRNEAGNNTLRDALIYALSLEGIQLEMYPGSVSYQTRQLDGFDTVQDTLGGLGFSLVRESGAAPNVLWRLQYIDSSLCNPQHNVPMEALPNADHEKASYQVVAVMSGGVRAFLYKVSVATKNKDRITTFPELQSLFPGFNAKVASPQMLLVRSLRVETKLAADLYRGSAPLNIELRIEEVQQADKSVAFWRIVIVAKTIYAEQNVNSVHKVVASTVRTMGAACRTHNCGAPFNDAFFL